LLDGSLLVDNEGLHGMVEKCGSAQLSSGDHIVYVEGFQARGGVGMVTKYSGPDTGGAKIFMMSGRVSSPFFPTCAPPAAGGGADGFDLCMFRSNTGLDITPRIGDDVAAGRLQYVGRGRMPAVDIQRLETFREYVPRTPDANYAWAMYGQLQIAIPGSYTLCITSDDG
jgi:hypothetical protein